MTGGSEYKSVLIVQEGMHMWACMSAGCYPELALATTMLQGKHIG